MVKAKVIKLDPKMTMPKPEGIRGMKYCKVHYTFNHSIINCVKFKDWIHDLIKKRKMLLEKPQATMIIDVDLLNEAPITMVNLKWPESNNRKFTLDNGGEKQERERER